MEYITVLEVQKYSKDSRRIESLKKTVSPATRTKPHYFCQRLFFSPDFLIRSRWSRPHRHATGTKLSRVWTLALVFFILFCIFIIPLLFLYLTYINTLLVRPIDEDRTPMFLNRFNTVQKEAVAWAGPRRPPGPFNLFNPVTVSGLGQSIPSRADLRPT